MFKLGCFSNKLKANLVFWCFFPPQIVWLDVKTISFVENLKKKTKTNVNRKFHWVEFWSKISIPIHDILNHSTSSSSIPLIVLWRQGDNFYGFWTSQIFHYAIIIPNDFASKLLSRRSARLFSGDLHVVRRNKRQRHPLNVSLDLCLVLEFFFASTLQTC